MYYFVSKDGLRVRMGGIYEIEFEKIKWNEGEVVIMRDNSGELEMKTIAGKYQGQRKWVYTRRMGNIIDKGRIEEYYE